jgi:hypothetical protein
MGRTTLTLTSLALALASTTLSIVAATFTCSTNPRTLSPRNLPPHLAWAYGAYSLSLRGHGRCGGSGGVCRGHGRPMAAQSPTNDAPSHVPLTLLCLTSTSHCSEPPAHERCRCGSAHPRGARVPPWWRHGGALVSRRWSQARRRRRRGGRQRIPRSRPTPSHACPQTRVLAAGTTATASYTTGWGPRRSLTSSWRARELGYVTPTRRVVLHGRQRPRCYRVGGPDGVLTRTRDPVTRAPTQRRERRARVLCPCGAARVCACHGIEQGAVQKDVTANLTLTIWYPHSLCMHPSPRAPSAPSA